LKIYFPFLSDSFFLIRHNGEFNYSALKINSMKDFMFLFRGPDPHDLNPTPEQSQAMTQKWIDWISELGTKGRFVSGDAFNMKEGKTVQGKKMVVTDGPFAEGKELMGGFCIVRAESLEEATELAFGFPDFDKGGFVEVRELMKMPTP
jgi:hypothetical protein